MLLDTHLLLWAAEGSPALPRRVRALLEDPAQAVWFSVASIWEVAIKKGLAKEGFTIEPSELRDGLIDAGYRELAIDGRHCLPVQHLPRLHGDPFDRLLVAQARVEGITLVTSDAAVRDYGEAVWYLPRAT